MDRDSLHLLAARRPILWAGTVLLAALIPLAASADSAWGAEVAADDNRGAGNQLVWCRPQLDTSSYPNRVEGSLTRTNSRGDETPNVVTAIANFRVAVQCFESLAVTGSSVVAVSDWSNDDSGDVASVRCPSEKPYAAFPRCQMQADAGTFVYGGTACGDGIRSVSGNRKIGQLTGDALELNDTNTLFNDTSDGNLGVGGKTGSTDLGYPFFSDGSMHFAFGDSYSTNINQCLPGDEGCPAPNYQDGRGNVLYSSTDFHADDGDGLAFTGYRPSSGDDAWAGQFIPWNDELDEEGVIPSGGFAITEGNTTYRYVWFMSVKTWWADADPEAGLPAGLRIHRSGFAVSVDGGPWRRSDEIPGAPVWEGDHNHFAHVGIWHDRQEGRIYIYGVKAQMASSDSGVALAYVEAEHDKIMDPTQYHYWTALGNTWQRDSQGTGAEWLASTNIVAGATSSHVRELSVSYNAHANRYIMMLSNTESNRGRVDLLQSESPIGPWESVIDQNTPLEDWPLPTVISVLFDDPARGGETIWAGNYAPMVHQRYMVHGGEHMHYWLSEWVPYNVGAWRVDVQRDEKFGCKRLPPDVTWHPEWLPSML